MRAQLWLAGARPRTLPVSVSPVLVGTAVAAAEGPLVAWRALAAAVVALALQVGVNYANDYSDGRRGTDANRQGPARLTASGAVPAAAVATAAGVAFGVAALAGLALAVAVDLRLLGVGVACFGAAVGYTGGKNPYGYRGYGEVAVLVFFGFVATAGSTYVQTGTLSGTALVAAVPMGLLACSILVLNNLRDRGGDAESGKRTLAVVLGAPRTRDLYRTCLLGALVAVVLLGAARPSVLLALLAAPIALTPLRTVSRRRDAPSLVAALVGTARLQLVVAVLLALGLWRS